LLILYSNLSAERTWTDTSFPFVYGNYSNVTKTSDGYLTLYKQADNSYTEKSYVSLDGWVQSGWEIGHSGSIEDTYDYNEATGLKFQKW